MKNFNNEEKKGFINRKLLEKMSIKTKQACLMVSLITVIVFSSVFVTESFVPTTNAGESIMVESATVTEGALIALGVIENATTTNDEITNVETTTTTTTNITTTTESTTTEDTTTTTEGTTTVELVVEEDIIEEEIYIEEEYVPEEIVFEEEIIIPEYIVYKPSTYYVHRSTCHWFDDTCYEITSTEGLESRKCSECDPDIDIITEYIEPVTEPPVEETPVVDASSGYPIGSDGLPHAALLYVTEEERIYLCNTVGTEYGSDWVSTYDKALVVAVVMNRLADGGWQGSGRDNTIYNILTAPYQFNPDYAVPYYRSNVTASCIEAVDYYFENQGIFPHYTSFYGDGTQNYFR